MQSCPDCGSKQLRNKGVLRRIVRHASWAGPRVWVRLTGKRWLCKECGKRFRHRFAGILPRQHSTEAFRFKVFKDHWMASAAAVWPCGERSAAPPSNATPSTFSDAWRRSGPELPVRKCLEMISVSSRKHGYATTFCGLKNHSVYHVTLGRNSDSVIYSSKRNARASIASA